MPARMSATRGPGRGSHKPRGPCAETGRGDEVLSGMGTTLTVAVIFGQTLYCGHVGDSRCYVINRFGIEKVSRDHSLVGRLVEIRLRKSTPDRIGREVDAMIRQALQDNLRGDIEAAMEVDETPEVEPHLGP